MQAGHRVRGFQGLPRRVALRGRITAVEGAAAVDEELYAGVAIALAETRVVGRTFVAELTDRRQRRVMSEVFLAGEHRLQHPTGGGVLDAAVELAVEVGGGEVHAAICRVGAGADSAGIGRPHAGGRTTRHQQRHGALGGLGDHLRVTAGKAQAAQNGNVRTLLREQYALLEAHVHQRLHFRQPLLGGFLGTRHGLTVALRRDVTVGQPTVVVSRPDQAVDIHFKADIS